MATANWEKSVGVDGYLRLLDAQAQQEVLQAVCSERLQAQQGK